MGNDEQIERMINRKPRVRKERTRWRDKDISERHRTWSWDCPMVDIDFMVVEYDDAVPVALIEFKHARKRAPVHLGSASLRALESLATRAQLPLFLVWYDPTPWRFYVLPCNERAQRYVEGQNGDIGAWLTEREFVALQYRLRRRPFPAELWDKLDHELSGNEARPFFKP